MAGIAEKRVESFRRGRMEREMGFEPTTAALEGRGSSAELLPLADRDLSGMGRVGQC